MTNYPRSAYGAHNPNAGYPANGNVAAWGGFCWPKGVPADLIRYTNYISKTTGQTAKVPMRSTLVPLWNLAFQIMDVKHHYPVYANVNGENWGPWGYSNRPIANTQIPSGHSVAVSVDINAPYNPYSSRFISDMPPAMVADLESLFLYWGGRYTGKKFDPMHWGFCRKPEDVQTAINRAKSILGTTPVPKPPQPLPEDDVTPADIDAIANAVVAKLNGTVSEYTDPYAAWQGKDAHPDLTSANAAKLNFQYSSAAFRDAEILRGVKPS